MIKIIKDDTNHINGYNKKQTFTKCRQVTESDHKYKLINNRSNKQKTIVCNTITPQSASFIFAAMHCQEVEYHININLIKNVHDRKAENHDDKILFGHLTLC